VAATAQGKRDIRTAKDSARQGETRRTASEANKAVFTAMNERASENFFAQRGLSGATIAALIGHGIVLPEELLFMTEEELRGIPELDGSAIAEIEAYRRRFPGKP